MVISAQQPLRPRGRAVTAAETFKYTSAHKLPFIFEFVVSELAEHRPKNWKVFLLASLHRLPHLNVRRKVLRALPGGETLRHEISPEAFLHSFNIRAHVDIALEDTVMVQPPDAVGHIRTLFEMPYDLLQLHRDGILGVTFDEFAKTNAHDAVILKPAGQDWSEEADALTCSVPATLSRNDALYMRLAGCFEAWDVSGSGLLEIEEVGGAMSAFEMWPSLRAIIGSERLDKAELTALFRQLWANDSMETRESLLDALEHAVTTFAREYPFTQQVAALFALIDENQTLTVDVAELKPLLSALGADIVDFSQVVFEALDVDDSGHVGPVEFQRFIRQLFGGAVGEEVVTSLGVLIARLQNQTRTGLIEAGVAITNSAMISEESIKLNALFGACDVEKKGYVREDDVKRLFADVGADWDAAADRFGLNGASDRVSADSFRAVMRWAWSDLKEGVTWAATKALEVLQQRIQHGVGASGTEANIMISDAIRPDELMTDLRELFKLWDSDGSGVIEGAELRMMLRDAALGDGADAIDAATQLSEDAFVGFIRTLWAEKTEAHAGVAVHALRKRMLASGTGTAGARESSVAEALFGQSEVKKRVLSLCDRWAAVYTSHPASASTEEVASRSSAANVSALEEASAPGAQSVTAARAQDVFRSIRKLPGGELWGAVSDKLALADRENFLERALSSEDLYHGIKAEMDMMDEASWPLSLVLLDNSVRSLEQEAALKVRTDTAVLRELFQLFDKDDSGALSVAELTHAMNAAGLQGDAAWENAGNNSFDIFAEDEDDAKEMTAEEFIDFLVSKWGAEALGKAETLLAGAKQLGRE